MQKENENENDKGRNIYPPFILHSPLYQIQVFLWK